MDKDVIKVGNMKVHVITDENRGCDNLSEEELDMDKRAKAAVNAAIQRAKVCNKPIAKYDARKKKAYLLYPNGEKQYVN